MYLSKIHIENFRILKDVNINFDKSLTLFVGKNNCGKTSIIHLMDFLLSNNSNLEYNDYPLDSRKKLIDAINVFWESISNSAFEDFKKSLDITKIRLTISYSEDDSYAALSEFIIDLEPEVFIALIDISFEIPNSAETILLNMKQQCEYLGEIDINKLTYLVEKTFSSLFEMKIVAVDPTNEKYTYERNKSHLLKLFNAKFIYAERALDESNDNNGNPFERVLKSVFKQEFVGVENQLETTLNELRKVVSSTEYSLQKQINDHLNIIVETMLPFGYPAAEDMSLNARAILELEKKIINDAELTYVSNNNTEALPSTHNGLGYKNLIKISMELHSYARDLQDDLTKIPILFIEEPEAHMHPQLQTTFVKYLNDFLKDISGTRNIQSIITTHSAHIANTVPFQQVRYLRRYNDYSVVKAMVDFPNETANAQERNECIDFMQKYMKLSYCDLYFCDKAILVEGASERLLIPKIIERLNPEFENYATPTLQSQYYTIVEVGGAYAYRFFEFVDYLDLPTLILTDIDFVNGSGRSCQEKDAVRSSNATISRWCHDVYDIAVSNTIEIETVFNLANETDKQVNGMRHIQFQKKSNGFHPRSLEEAIIHENRALFDKKEDEEVCFKDENQKKTDFAIMLLIDPKFSDFVIPSYIKEGLIWLNRQSKLDKGQKAIRKHKTVKKGKQ